MLLSIITITYNNLEGLKKTHSSLAGIWPGEHTQWIVIDGGSNDGTTNFLEEIAPEIWISEKDNGIYDAMNKGAGLSQGDYVWFLNSGDCVNPNLSKPDFFNALTQNKDIVYSDTLLANNNVVLGSRSALTTRKLPNHLTVNSWLKGMVIGHQSMIVKTSVSEHFDTQLKHVADYNWAIEITRNAKNYLLLPTPIAIFDVSGHSSRNRKESNMERFKVMIKHFGWFKTCVVHLGIVWLNLASILKNKNRY